MPIFVSTAYAQEEPHEAPAAGEAHAETEAHGGGHGAFPPFDPATFGSQLFWLAITFGALYLLMSRVVLPRIGGILETRSNRVAGDLAEAGRLKQETDAAIAAYEQALAEARQSAHAIAQKARDAAKAEIDADRRRIEAELQGKLDAAEARIGEVKNRALAEVGAIANEAAEAMVETLLGLRVGKPEIAGAVKTAMAERG
jgi:F-type H+-transporting ATPase subunit b